MGSRKAVVLDIIFTHPAARHKTALDVESAATTLSVVGLNTLNPPTTPPLPDGAACGGGAGPPP